MKASYQLLTNINLVEVIESTPRLRLEANALLIENEVESFPGFLPPHSRLRDFGCDPALPIFTYWFKEPITYQVEPVQDDHHVFLSDGHLKPIFSGCLLKLTGGLTLYLNYDDVSQPLDEQTIAGDINVVWESLLDKTMRYAQTPYVLRAEPVPNFRLKRISR